MNPDSQQDEITMNIVPKLKSMRSVFRQWGVIHAWVFGSAARGEKTHNDVDVMVEFETAPTFLGYMNLKFDLEQALGSRVDLVTKASCPVRFLRRIQPDLVQVG